MHDSPRRSWSEAHDAACCAVILRLSYKAPLRQDITFPSFSNVPHEGRRFRRWLHCTFIPLYQGKRLAPYVKVALVEVSVALQHFQHHRIVICQDDWAVLQATVLRFNCPLAHRRMHAYHSRIIAEEEEEYRSKKHSPDRSRTTQCTIGLPAALR